MRTITAFALVITLLLAGASYGLDRISNGTGGGLFGDPNSWSNGVPVGNDYFAIQPGDVITVPNGYYHYSNNGRPVFGGLLVVEPDGTIRVDRVITTIGTWGPWGGGGINCSGTFSCARLGPTAPFTVNLYAGTFTIEATVAANSHSNAIYGGRFMSGSTSMTGGTYLNDGTIDGNNAALYFGKALNWIKGTIVNKQFASNTDRGTFNNQFKVNCLFDINDQTHTNGPIVVDFGPVNYNWTTGGVVQFDVYSSNSNDCDCLYMSFEVLNNNVDSNVVFEIGDGLGLPGTFADYMGVTYQIILATNNLGQTDYGDFRPTVTPIVTWNIGGTDYPVGLITNNVPIDGTVQVIPEPAAALAAVCTLLWAARRK